MDAAPIAALPHLCETRRSARRGLELGDGQSGSLRGDAARNIEPTEREGAG